MDYAKHVQTRVTPQTEPVPGKNMVPNNAGGHTFAVDDWSRLDRFLILGAEGGTYYMTERALTRENATIVGKCLAADAKRTIDRIVEISTAGRAPKNDPAVFALALAAADSPPARKLAYDAIPAVCRIGTHLFQFVAAVDQLRGWGGGLCRAVSRWYTEKSPDSLAYQVTKYQSRNGWSHRDVLRKCHASANGSIETVLRWCTSGAMFDTRTITRGQNDAAKTRTYAPVAVTLPESILVLESLRVATTVDGVVDLINKHGPLAPRELVPTQFLSDSRVWSALLPHMPMTAMIRNLGTMTRNGTLTPLSDGVKHVVTELQNAERIRKSRLHPLAILVAMKTYQLGHGVKSSGDGWTPIQPIVDALNDAYYMAFDAVEPTGKRWMFGLDVSGSMGAMMSGTPISCAMVTAALAMVSIRTEPWTHVGGFTSTYVDLGIGRNDRLDAAMQKVYRNNFGTTDCAVPVLYATDNKIPVDVFVTITDNETYAGNIHPFQALQQYRQKMGIPARNIVIGLTASGFTINDPADALGLDIAGFSTDIPAVMSAFVS